MSKNKVTTYFSFQNNLSVENQTKLRTIFLIYNEYLPFPELSVLQQRQKNKKKKQEQEKEKEFPLSIFTRPL